MTFVKELLQAKEREEIPEKVYRVLNDLYHSYASQAEDASIFHFLLKRVEEQVKHPYTFHSFHRKMRAPHDFYAFGLDFARPLVKSLHISHLENVTAIVTLLHNNENVVFFANHQTELDPQLFSVALEKTHPRLAEEIIFVAGDRVLTDPVAVPFSLGRNLLCIYSKRHIGNPPEKRHEKMLHNQKTMKRMKEMLSLGGQCIYVAPSGGRDRKNEKGEIPISPFDPNNIEMFRLMAEHADQKTHFFPLVLATHDILPPPAEIENELGEMRKVEKKGIALSFLEEINITLADHIADRLEKRKTLSDHIWNRISLEYQDISKRI